MSNRRARAHGDVSQRSEDGPADTRQLHDDCPTARVSSPIRAPADGVPGLAARLGSGWRNPALHPRIGGSRLRTPTSSNVPGTFSVRGSYTDGKGLEQFIGKRPRRSAPSGFPTRRYRLPAAVRRATPLASALPGAPTWLPRPQELALPGLEPRAFIHRSACSRRSVITASPISDN
jgi:hypothetical protein